VYGFQATGHNISWVGGALSSDGVRSASSAASWTLLDPLNPSYIPTLWATGLGNGNPTGSQTIVVKVASDFLFTNTSSDVHFVIGLNYAPVYSNQFFSNTITNGLYYGVYGNQASAFDLGAVTNMDINHNQIVCHAQGTFEAIYQLPTSLPNLGVTTLNGQTPNNITNCIMLPRSCNVNAAGDYEVLVTFVSNYDGSASASLVSPSGCGQNPSSTTPANWQSWFAQRTTAGTVPRNTGVALAVLGTIPPGNHITAEIVSMSAN